MRYRFGSYAAQIADAAAVIVMGIAVQYLRVVAGLRNANAIILAHYGREVYGNDDEKKVAETSKEQLALAGKFNKPIVTEILPAMKFYPAEAYHQKYYQQNPEHFEAFEEGSGRVSFKKKAWEQ